MPLTRMSQKDIKEKEPNRLWDHTVLISLDRDNVGNWLEEEARKCVNVSIINTYKNKKSHEEKETYIKTLAKENYHKFGSGLKTFYTLKEMPSPNQLLQDHTKDGVLKRHAPSVLSIILWLIFFLAMASIEVIFFSYPWLYKGAGIAGPIIALTLALGGVLTGISITEKFMNKVYSKYSMPPGDPKKWWFYVGIVLIAASVGVRTWVAGILGLITTVILGSAVAASETLFEYSLHRRKFCKDNMFKVQEYFAAQEFARSLGEIDDIYDDEWYLHFEHEVKKYIEKDAY
ncbi:MAG: hypothetical protein HZC16_04030 [Candidatus Omnitrophica bacterium]|nr:hypothetical protein [Candidatus Omnitrophota bacterium]